VRRAVATHAAWWPGTAPCAACSTATRTSRSRARRSTASWSRSRHHGADRLRGVLHPRRPGVPVRARGEIRRRWASKSRCCTPAHAVYYDSTQPHLVKCHGTKPAKILAVIYAGRNSTPALRRGGRENRLAEQPWIPYFWHITMPHETIEIRWHGRGGQGAITAAKIFAQGRFTPAFPAW